MAFDAKDLVIRISGDPHSLTEKVSASSVVAKAISDKRDSPKELVSAARGEYRQLLGVLYASSYFSPEISVKVDGQEAANIPILHGPTTVSKIVITITPGPTFKFADTKIAPLAPNTELPERFSAGAPASVPAMEAATKVAVASWRDAGHAKVDISGQNIVANHDENTISAEIALDPGPKLTFGNLIVEGNEAVRTDRILAIAGLPVGQVYDPEELDISAARLRRAGVFSSVAIRDADEIGPNNTLPVDLTVTENKPRRFGFGAKVSSVEGIGLNAYWLHRNLLGGAERLQFDFEIDNIGATDADNGVDYKFSTDFQKPAAFGTDRDLYANLTLAREDEPGYLSNTIDISAGQTRIVNDKFQWRAGLLYRAGLIEDAFGDRQYHLLGVPVQATWDSRNIPLDATKGFFAKALVMPFLGFKELDSGALFELDTRTYRSLGSRDRFVLAGRAQLGALVGADADMAPPDYLFFAGGGGSVRGQPYQALGVGEIDDTVIGGSTYLALSGEVRTKITTSIGAVAFYDAGFVGDGSFDENAGGWLTGAGIGMRYDTGFGPLRADVAFPVSGTPSDASSFQLYIGIGQAF